MAIDSLVNALIILGQLQGLLIASALLAGAARGAEERRRALCALAVLGGLLLVYLGMRIQRLRARR